MNYTRLNCANYMMIQHLMNLSSHDLSDLECSIAQLITPEIDIYQIECSVHVQFGDLQFTSENAVYAESCIACPQGQRYFPRSEAFYEPPM